VSGTASSADLRVADGNKPGDVESAVRTPAQRTDIEAAPQKSHPSDPLPQELQLNMRSAELGRIEIHTTIKEDHVTAHLAVENNVAQRALASELSDLRGTLAAADLKLDNLSIASSADSRSAGMQFGGGSRQDAEQPRPFLPTLAHRQKEDKTDDPLQECSINVVV
jgi:flagellar hook-length control protein FliK